MKRLIAVGSLALLCACSTAKYEVNPDGSRPKLYPATEVIKWPVVDGAHQSPTTNARIYIEPSVNFDKDVQLGDGVRIAAGAYLDEDVMLFPNVIVGEGSQVGGDGIVQGDVKIGNHVLIRGDVVIGPSSVIEDGASLGKGTRLGKRVTVGAGATLGVGCGLAMTWSFPNRNPFLPLRGLIPASSRVHRYLEIRGQM